VMVPAAIMFLKKKKKITAAAATIGTFVHRSP
jgi:hypothetical protein